MKATEASFLLFLQKSNQFVIPIYQRTYSWTEKECRQLWDDILRAGEHDNIAAHFVGSIVYIQQGLAQVIHQPPLLVIDGQQRLTSVMLILEALARQVGESEPEPGFSALKIRSYYLQNTLESGEGRFKLILTQTDKSSFLALMQQKPLPTPSSRRVAENFAYFEDRVKSLGADLGLLCRGLSKLVIVDIALSRDTDNPQLIFESMNSTGRELSQADLIRNFVLMGLPPTHQTQLYEDHWRPMEVNFGQQAYTDHFDRFMRDYLTFKTGDIPNVRAVYEAFKRHVAALGPGVSNDATVSEIHAFSRYYCAMALGREHDRELAAAFQDLRELKIDVAYPFLLELYADYEGGVLTKRDFILAVRLVESYVFRRAVCSIPTNSLNKTFAALGRSLQKDRYLESLQASLLTLPSYRRFPTDEEFRREIVLRDLYNFRSRSYWLRRMENHARKEPVPVGEYTIEHILPQNANLSVEWQRALGEDWQRIQESLVHTLGNLTLTGYNIQYSDHPFPKKRDMEGGFKQSPIRLNEGLGGLETWDESTIRNRAARLAGLACDVWVAPQMDANVLQEYQFPVEKFTGFTIADHDNLDEDAPMRPLFDSLRREILALDPCVTETYLKQYVAYKAETNFVDVVALKKGLRLTLNMHFHELSDPEAIAVDVTDKGGWGNGDVEVDLNSTAQLPYAMGLIRQSFEKQMGAAEEPA